MAVVFASTACTLWCPHCGKVTQITCYRHTDVTTGRHATCDNKRNWDEDIPKLEEYFGFQFRLHPRASSDEREVRG